MLESFGTLRRSPPMPENKAGHCRWCGTGPLPGSPNRAWCLPHEGRECYKEFSIATKQSDARFWVFRRDRGVCFWCDGDFSASEKSWHVDHRRPLWLAPKQMTIAERDVFWGMQNLQTLCVPCHKAKSLRETNTRRKMATRVLVIA